MDSRGFFIRNFRNIGVCKDNKEQGAFLRLSGLEKDVLGGLVIILGENNTGKSNLLDALAKFGSSHEQPLSDKDSPSFLECSKCSPSIELSYRFSAYSIYYPNDPRIKDTSAQKTDFKQYIDELQKSIDAYDVYIDYKTGQEVVGFTIQNTTLGNRMLSCRTQDLECIDDTHIPPNIASSKPFRLRHCLVINPDKVDKKIKNFNYYDNKQQPIISPFVKDYKAAISIDSDKKIQKSYSVRAAFIKNNDGYQEIPLTHYELEKNIYKEVPHIDLGLRFTPQIILYEKVGSEAFDAKHLTTTPDEIHKSTFFSSLFSIINGNQPNKILENIQEAYKKDNLYNTMAYCEKVEVEINELLHSINDCFDVLCRAKDKEELSERGIYNFKIKLCDNKISLNIYKYGQPLNLDEQSVGFRKFFNFFFNFIYINKAKAGDIVLIDEAETHLSVPAQREFRKFLKIFGQQLGILFVVSTHSPFMIDMQYLDEVRILKTKDDGLGIEIKNDFYLVESNQANTLLELKGALGVDYHYLFKPQSKPIFVEGITDYNYLTAFAALYEKEKELNLSFLPINGLGKKEREEVLKSIIKFGKKLNASPVILLVDTDKAGEEMREIANKYAADIKVIGLNDAPKIKELLKEGITIEDFFDENDKKVFGISKGNKRSLQSSAFKYAQNLGDRLNSSTKENFFALLDYLYQEAHSNKQEKEDNAKT